MEVLEENINDRSINEITEKKDEIHQFLTFSVGEEIYGVNIMIVKEIKGWTDPTRIPNASQYVRGVINLRGTIIPIFDLKARFGVGDTDVNKKSVIVVISVRDKIIGILVDGVSDILSVMHQDIKKSENQSDNDYIDGLLSVNDKMVILLNTEKLLKNDLDIKDEIL